MINEVEFALKKRISEGESQIRDFKFALNDSRKIARSMSAFSNTDGGSLLLGVKDNGVIAGIRSEEEFYMAEMAASMYCKPEITFKSVLYDIDKKEVLEIIISPKKEVLTLAPNEQNTYVAYIRHNDANYIAGKIYENVWRKRKSKRNRNISINEYHRAVIELIDIKKVVSINQIMQKLDLKKTVAEALVEQLILFGIADFVFTENGVMYGLKTQ